MEFCGYCKKTRFLRKRNLVFVLFHVIGVEALAGRMLKQCSRVNAQLQSRTLRWANGERFAEHGAVGFHKELSLVIGVSPADARDKVFAATAERQFPFAVGCNFAGVCCKVGQKPTGIAQRGIEIVGFVNQDAPRERHLVAAVIRESWEEAQINATLWCRLNAHIGHEQARFRRGWNRGWRRRNWDCRWQDRNVADLETFFVHFAIRRFEIHDFVVGIEIADAREKVFASSTGAAVAERPSRSEFF